MLTSFTVLFNFFGKSQLVSADKCDALKLWKIESIWWKIIEIFFERAYILFCMQILFENPENPKK